MPCCATGKCDDPNCYMCVIMPQKFAPVVPCPKVVLAKGRNINRGREVPCRLVKGHDKGPHALACRPLRKKFGSDGDAIAAADVTDRERSNPLRDGQPMLPAAARKRRHPMFEKRTRVGPSR